jgi:hypothetical protein
VTEKRSFRRNLGPRWPRYFDPLLTLKRWAALVVLHQCSASIWKPPASRANTIVASSFSAMKAMSPASDQVGLNLG